MLLIVDVNLEIVPVSHQCRIRLWALPNIRHQPQIENKTKKSKEPYINIELLFIFLIHVIHVIIFLHSLSAINFSFNLFDITT